MDTSKVTRVETINHYVGEDNPDFGRKQIIWAKDAKVELMLQDDERTLKIFITKK